MIGSYQSPLGWITYEMIDDELISMYFSDDKNASKLNHDDHVNHELMLYFTHQKEKFDIKVKFTKGTLFQKEVWSALTLIPYGKTITYKELAEQINRPKAFRAVGQACKHNPIGLVVPCHRVIGSDGSMTGYSGKDFIDLKRRIIDFEKDENA